MRVTAIAAELPAATVADVGMALIAKSVCCPTPVPVSNTICGLPGALSTRVRAPMLDPGPVGAKVMVILQFVVGCSGVFAQSSVSVNSPLVVILVNVTGEVPLFVAVMDIVGGGVWPTCCCPNDRLEAESVRVDA